MQDAVAAAAMRHDLEEALIVKIENARLRLVRAVNANQPMRVRDQLARRVDELRAQLHRVEAWDVKR